MPKKPFKVQLCILSMKNGHETIEIPSDFDAALWKRRSRPVEFQLLGPTVWKSKKIMKKWKIIRNLKKN